MSEAAMPSACPRHPTQQAFVSCRRCGRLACAYCLPDSAGGHTCTDCVALVEMPGVIAWERSDLNVFARFWRTTRDVLTKTQVTFSELGSGSVSAAVGYAAVLHAVLSIAALLFASPCVMLAALGWQTPLLGPSSAYVLPLFIGASCGAPLLLAGAGAFNALFVGTLFHLAARSLGGTGTYVDSVRAAAYATAVVAIWVLLAPGVVLPVVGPVVLGIAGLAQLLWLGSVLTNVASERHALRDGHARLAGFAPSVALIVLVVVALVAMRLVGEAIDPTQGPDVYR